jgi:hypothetical protein
LAGIEGGKRHFSDQRVVEQQTRLLRSDNHEDNGAAGRPLRTKTSASHWYKGYYTGAK